MVRIGVLASGTGSILSAFLQRGLPVVVVVVDRACPATAVAAAGGVPAAVVARDGFGPGFDRAAYTERVVAALAAHDVDLVAMAGFGTVLGQAVFDVWPGKVLNTHPALLPAFPGWRPVADALAAGVKVTGCTVHLATLEADQGPILAQEEVEVRPGDTVSTLHERIKVVERRLYPDTVEALIRGTDLEELAPLVSRLAR